MAEYDKLYKCVRYVHATIASFINLASPAIFNSSVHCIFNFIT